MNETMEMDAGPQASSYFSRSEHAALLYTHIALMTVAWVFFLPVAVVLSIAASRHTFLTQSIFTVVNALGVLAAILYNARTPDLYPNNAHRKIGWIISAVVAAYVVMGVLSRRKRQPASRRHKQTHETQPFMSRATTTAPDGQRYGCKSQECRPSSDSSCQNMNDDSVSSLGENSDTTQVETDDEELSLPLCGDFDSGSRRVRHQGRFLSALCSLQCLRRSRIASRSPCTYLAYAYKVIDRIILPFGFVALTTGIATYGRFFEGRAIFNGLAHWIKGGVFFWLGLFNLGRWAGSFADLGWAWNIRPVRANGKSPPTAEFVESLLIFFYGSTNIFLEHLNSSDGKWAARDLEHLAITVLFIGGGLCGMLVESTRVRHLLNATVPGNSPSESYSDRKMKQNDTPSSNGVSLNPMPALVICLLGIMMGSHHQSSMTSTMVHKQWGNLLLGASFARCFTYILMYIRPPSSALPSRPPTELLASFGLMAGGIIFMASSADVVKGMIHNHLDAMFLYTVTMGLVGILMAWEVVVLALKGLAVRRENNMPRCTTTDAPYDAL